MKLVRGRDRLWRVVRLSAALVALPAALEAQAAKEWAPSSSPAVSEMRLRPGDVVRVEVRDEPSLGGQFPVAEDGNIMIPLLGIIPVAGRPFEEVEADVRAAYARELADPVIRVLPMVRIAVLGEVMRPGLFPVDATLTVSDVLATVGGFTPFADRDEITLERDGVRTRIPYEPGEPGLQQPLRSGDRILVARRSWFSENLAIFVGAAASVAAAAVTTLIVR
ncbi:MAG TPA: polysaccharide biosynthesis/export family protein [Longimicrobiales bacterium]